jgi:hypothetical protein
VLCSWYPVFSCSCLAFLIILFCLPIVPSFQLLLFIICFYYSIGPCHSLSVKSQASRRGDLGSIPGQAIWDLWWTKWHWGRFFGAYFGFPCQAFHRLLHHPGLGNIVADVPSGLSLTPSQEACYSTCISFLGACDSVDCWETVLQTGRSLVRVPMRSLKFFQFS